MTLEQLLEKLFCGQTLLRAESHQLFCYLMEGKLTPEQLAGVLIALKLRGETTEEIAGAVTATIENASPFPRPDYAFADIVGTGGDGTNSINISTASSIVAAAMGYKIAKHGSRSVSSKTGASDLLTTLGVNIEMSAEQARKALDEINLCFLFAPKYHMGFQYAVPVRQSLKTRTLFNILGPLANPAAPKRQLLGVYSPELIAHYAQAVQALNHEHSIVVHGSGLDEVAIHGETQVAEIENGDIRYFTVTPEDFGVPRYPLSALEGGEPSENAQKLTALLQGNGEPAHIDAVAVNVAMLMRLFGGRDLKANVQKVKAVLATDQAYRTLLKLASY